MSDHGPPSPDGRPSSATAGRDGDVHPRRPRGHAQQGRAADRRGRAGRHLRPPLLLPPAHGAGGRVPDVPGRGERPAWRHADAELLHRGRAGHGGRHRLRQGEEGPGRRPRVPPDQPPARLPGVRQGRRVPPAGPDPGLRPGRDPLRRGEAPLREADAHLGAGPARPRAVHPVQPVHPVRRRGGGRGPDRLHRAGRADPDRHLPRAARSRRTSRATPCRSARWAPSPPRPTGSRPGPGTSTRSSPPARRARSGAGWRCSRRPTGSPVSSASTSTRSTTAGCATRAGSRPTPSTPRTG